MAKIDKSQYSKSQWKNIKEQRRLEKQERYINKDFNKKIELFTEPVKKIGLEKKSTAFVLGNGTSRRFINPTELKIFGNIYGCNALYRTFAPHYLVAVDTKMILEINKSGYQNKHEVWTNPNKAYQKMQNFNYFNPSKGWSSGPTALWLASQHGYETIYILGFDYKGLDEGKRFNNIYADTVNYKKSQDGATFFGNWLRQTKSVIQENKKIHYVRVIAPDNYQPDELNNFDNFSTITVENFQRIFGFSATC
jgi:hypothetical protein